MARPRPPRTRSLRCSNTLLSRSDGMIREPCADVVRLQRGDPHAAVQSFPEEWSRRPALRGARRAVGAILSDGPAMGIQRQDRRKANHAARVRSQSRRGGRSLQRIPFVRGFSSREKPLGRPSTLVRAAPAVALATALAAATALIAASALAGAITTRVLRSARGIVAFITAATRTVVAGGV